MAAYLLITSATDARAPRRVDLENYASLFSDVEEPDVVRRRDPIIAWLSALLLLVLTIGAMIVMARPEALTPTPSGSTAAIAVPSTRL